MSQKSLTTIYLPGLGRKNDGFRQFALGLWPRKYNAQFLPMNWTDKNETYQQKKQRVLDAISAAEGQVILIGESAGAAIGIVVASENPDIKLVTLCGKIGGAASTGQEYYDRVPTFRELLPAADRARDGLDDESKKRIVTVRAFKDIFLSLRDTTIPGVKQIVLPSIGHLPTIIIAITNFRYGIFKAIRILGEDR